MPLSVVTANRGKDYSIFEKLNPFVEKLVGAYKQKKMNEWDNEWQLELLKIMGNWISFLRKTVNKRVYIKKIKEIAQQDKRRRLDPRYLKVMGFLVAKGFLYINKNIHLNPNSYTLNLCLSFFRPWAGLNTEPLNP